MNINRKQYITTRDYIANPFDALYLGDVEPSKEPEIQEFLQIATDLEDSISGEIEGAIEQYGTRIKLNSLAFAEQGLILFKIKAWKSYKNKCNSFTDYCQQELGRSRSYCDRLISASRVILELIVAGHSILPRNESQCRILGPYAGSELIKVWSAIVETIEPHKITAQTISKFLLEEAEPEPEMDTKLLLPNYLERAIHPHASIRGLGVCSFVIMLLEEIFKPAKPKSNWRDFRQEEDWELDLDKLVDIGETILDSA